MSSERQRSTLYVIAGVNGAGKSSVAGETFRQSGADYYNPDEAARLLVTANPNLTQSEANGIAWHEGVRLLKRAIDERLDFAFETTLGANTIPRLLRKAANAANHPTRAARMGTPGIEIYVWYVGLESPELHIARVKSRVARGGHNISEDDIRRRYERSRLNLIDLLPVLRALRMFDNTSEADPAGGQTPKPILVLSMERGKILRPKDLTHTPAWAKPIVAAALRLTRKR